MAQVLLLFERTLSEKRHATTLRVATINLTSDLAVAIQTVRVYRVRSVSGVEFVAPEWASTAFPCTVRKKPKKGGQT